jgi:HlyD family secretion protein
MQPQANPGADPALQPNTAQVRGPQVVKPSAPAPEEESGGAGKWLILIGLIAAAGAGYWLWTQQQQRDQQAAEVKAGVRTATIAKANVRSTMRITGVTAAEKFVSLIAPQIRGNRGNRGRSDFSLAGMNNTSVSSVASLSAGVSAGGSSGALASSGGGGVRAGGNSRAASGRTAAPAKTSTAARASGGGSGGGDSLGSTSGQLNQGGGGGGGGGGGDFTLVLQNLVKPGTIVKQGDTIAEFDRQYMLQRLEDYKATMETAKAQLAQQKANLALARYVHDQNVQKAKGTLDKAKLDMKTVPVLSNIDAERVKLTLEEAEAQYKQQLAEGKFIDDAEKAQLKFAELEFKTLELEYKRSEQNADRMLTKAAIGGMTVMQNIFRGSEMAQIQQGDQVYPGQFFMQVVDPNSMIINATVNQVDAERMRIGLKATVKFDAYPGLEVPAHIVNIAAVPKTGGMRAAFVREIPVRLKIDKMDPRIIPDLSVAVDVVLAEEEQAVVAPLAGIFEDEAAPGKHYVYVKGANAWTRREVELGLETYLVVAVKGLQQGEEIALDAPPLNMEAATGKESKG